MAYKTILAFLDHPDRATQVGHIAAHVGERFDAVVEGIYVIPSLDALGALVSGGGGPSVVKSRRAELRELGEQASSRFRSAMSASSCQWTCSIVDSDHDFVGREIIERARVVDIVICNQTPADEDVLFVAEVPERVILESGRPVIVVPSGYDTLQWTPNSVLLAWDAGKEAARALTDSLPLLSLAMNVKPVWFVEDNGEGLVQATRDSFEAYLRRHDVDAALTTEQVTDANVPDTIGQMSLDGGYDLIVAGAYGESRLKELLLGGVTRWLLKKAKVPLFMSR